MRQVYADFAVVVSFAIFARDPLKLTGAHSAAFETFRVLRAFVMNPILFQRTNAGVRSCQSVALWYAAAVFSTV